MINKTLSITLTCLVIAGLTINITPTFSQSQAVPNKVTFYCKDISDGTGQKIRATLVWVPERKGNVRLIGWKSEYFLKKGWNPQKRCQEVTLKFQKAYEQGQLNFLTTGKSKGYPIICYVAQLGELCNEQNLLFTIKPNDNPDLVLQQLLGILDGKSSDLLLQSSDEHTYVPMKKFFQDAPKCTESAGSQFNCQPSK